MNVHDSVSHEQAVELLPWFVNGALDEQEQGAVLDHARACMICRRELTDLGQIHDAVSQGLPSSPVPEPDMRNINARIDALIDRRYRIREWLSRLGSLFSSPWRIAFAVQTVVLIVLASVLLWPQPSSVEFTTLTQPDNLPAGRFVRVVFVPDIHQSRLENLLDHYELKIIDGPSNRGVYTLRVDDSTRDGDLLVSGLQNDPNVLFAQPVVIGADR